MTVQVWKRLEDRALWLLEHPDQSSPRDILRGMALQMRLWRYRRSGPHVSWIVLLPVPDYRSRRGVVRETVWDRLKDWKARMSTLESTKRRQVEEPAISSRDAEVGWGDLEPFVNRCAGLLSPGPDLDPAASREDVFGLEGYRSLAHVRLQWTGRGPGAWRETVALIDRLRALLVRALRERERSEPPIR